MATSMIAEIQDPFLFKVSLLKFDIQGFFNNIPRGVLLHVLHSKGCLPVLLAFLQEFLTS